MTLHEFYTKLYYLLASCLVCRNSIILSVWPLRSFIIKNYMLQKIHWSFSSASCIKGSLLLQYSMHYIAVDNNHRNPLKATLVLYLLFIGMVYRLPLVVSMFALERVFVWHLMFSFCLDFLEMSVAFPVGA